MFDKFFEKSISFRIVIGFVSAVLLSFLLIYIFTLFAPTSNGLNGFQLLSKTTFDNDERFCIFYILSTETFCIFLIPALILLFAIYQKPAAILHVKNQSNKHIPTITLIFLILLIIVANIPGINLLSDINTKAILSVIGENSELWLNYLRIKNFMQNLISPELILINIFCMAILPAICEEIFFRGFMQTVAINVFKNKLTAVIVTAVIFSILHGDMFNFIPRFVLGIFLGGLFIYTQNIWFSIIAHTFHNSTVVVFNTLPDISTEIDTIGSMEHAPLLGCCSLLLLTGFFVFFIKKQKTDK